MFSANNNKGVHVSSRKKKGRACFGIGSFKNPKPKKLKIKKTVCCLVIFVMVLKPREKTSRKLKAHI